MLGSVFFLFFHFLGEMTWNKDNRYSLNIFVQYICLTLSDLISDLYCNLFYAFRDTPRKRSAQTGPGGPSKSAAIASNVPADAQPEEAVGENFPVSFQLFFLLHSFKQ